MFRESFSVQRWHQQRNWFSKLPFFLRATFLSFLQKRAIILKATPDPECLADLRSYSKVTLRMRHQVHPPHPVGTKTTWINTHMIYSCSSSLTQLPVITCFMSVTHNCVSLWLSGNESETHTPKMLLFVSWLSDTFKLSSIVLTWWKNEHRSDDNTECDVKWSGATILSQGRMEQPAQRNSCKGGLQEGYLNEYGVT